MGSAHTAQVTGVKEAPSPGLCSQPDIPYLGRTGALPVQARCGRARGGWAIRKRLMAQNRTHGGRDTEDISMSVPGTGAQGYRMRPSGQAGGGAASAGGK